MKHDLRHFVDDPTLTDKERVERWLLEQSTSEIFAVLVKMLRNRIELYERYAISVRHNACYNSVTTTKPDPETERNLQLLAKCRNKVMAGIPLEQSDYAKVFAQYNEPAPSVDTFMDHHVDGHIYIEAVNGLAK